MTEHYRRTRETERERTRRAAADRVALKRENFRIAMTNAGVDQDEIERLGEELQRRQRGLE